MFMDDDDEPKRYEINYDKLIRDIYYYNESEDQFHIRVNKMCLEIEAVDELVSLMPDFNAANFVIQNVKRKLK